MASFIIKQANGGEQQEGILFDDVVSVHLDAEAFTTEVVILDNSEVEMWIDNANHWYTYWFNGSGNTLVISSNSDAPANAMVYEFKF
tara:strand:- start:572 stop:832 length:261 start_codon:yes stop_codon:yes gene_type:complete